jgi:acyl CoA:acetate/3-ketoacid CoA transferase beta subunit
VNEFGTKDVSMSQHASDYTIDELFSVCISRQIVDGEVVGQGIATPLVMAGVILARCTHAPHLLLASAIGQSLCRDWAPLGLTRVEEQWLGHGLAFLSFSEIACELLPATGMKEFFRPAQVDAAGNFNNVVVGSDYAHPRMRLPGSGGIADVTGYNDKSYLYVPRHSRAVFVERVDFVSGLGHVRDRVDGSGPVYLVSNRGQFDFANGRMRLITYHAGESIEKIRAKTGFDLEIAPDAHETEPLTSEEVRLLREEIDPLSIRKLETLSGAPRKALLREILKQEELRA